MAFSDQPQLSAPVALLRRSLHRGRLGHAYLFLGDALADLEIFAHSFTKALNCERNAARFPEDADCCETCLSCRKIEHLNHADVRWVRPESKTRIISVDQIRGLLESVYLKPTEARLKVTVLVSVDRLNPQAANAFLKTLEEPPPNTIFVLLSTEPQRILETVLSRCLRLHCGGAGLSIPADISGWIAEFSGTVLGAGGGLFSRYRMLDALLQRLAIVKEEVERTLSEQSPIGRYDDADPKLIERWKEERSAAIEAEYRRRRAELLTALQFWLRDLWLAVRNAFEPGLAVFPQLAEATAKVASRLDARKATHNLEVLEATQRLLHSNVQEALALEIGLLRLSV